MLIHCKLDPRKQTSVKFESKRKMFGLQDGVKMPFAALHQTCPVADELRVHKVRIPFGQR